MDLKEEYILGKKLYDHWYYVSKGHALRKFLGNIKVKEVLDVGAGSGIFSRQLLDMGICNSSVCIDPNYLEEKIEVHSGKQIQFLRNIDKVTQELILMMDVLEHVQDDVLFLKKYLERMENNAHVLITVPAFQFMWSGHDLYLEHYRRYTIESIEEVAKKSGMTPIKSRYFFGSLFPIIVAIRMSKKILLSKGMLKAQSELKIYPNWINKSLIMLHDIECRTLFNFNKYFGLSIFCLCRGR